MDDETSAAAAGTTAWGQIALLTATNFIVAVSFGAILPYLPVYLQEEGHARVAMIGIVAAAVYFAMAVFAPLFGRAADAYGRKPFIVGGTFLSAVATLLFVTTVQPGWFVLFRFVEGLGAAMLTPAVFALVADVTSESTRSRAYGWLTTGQFGGLIAGPAIAAVVYQAAGGGLWGFRALFLAGGVLTAVAGVVLWAVLDEPERSSEAATQTTAAPVAAQTTAVPAAAQTTAVPAAAQTTAVPAATRPPLRSIATAPILAFFLLGATGSYCVGAFEVLWSIWLRHLGASMAYVSATWIAFSVPMLLSFAGGWVADRSNRYLVMVAGFATSGVVWILYGTTRDLTFFLALNAVEGLAIAFAYPAKEAFLTQVSPPDLLGTVMGVEQTAIQVATGIGTLLAPVLYESMSGYALGVGGVVTLVGLAITAPVLGREWRRLQREQPADEATRAPA